MIGALALVAGAALLATGSLRLSAVLAPRSAAAFLLGAYVIAWGQLVVVLWALSLFGWVTRWGLLAGLALVCLALLVDTRGWSDVRVRLRDAVGALREALADPVCRVLAVAVAAVLAYAVALGLGTPQNDFDTLVDHLWRAGLWMQNRAVGYPECACAPYVNAYPPHSEMGALATMVLGGSDRYVALVQGAAYVALAIGVVGVARGLGLGRPQALLGGLFVATLPVIALQASTAQNDLVVSSFLVAAVVLLLATGRGAPWLAATAAALAVGTKLTAVIGIPVLVVVALAATPAVRRGPRLAAVLAGSAVGAYWYVVNWRHTGSWDGGFPDEKAEPGVVAAVSRGVRSSIQLVELPGAVGRDRWLYAVTAAVLFVALAVLLWRRRGRGAIAVGAIAAIVAALPVLVPTLRRYLDQAYVDLWRAVGRDDLAVSPGRDITLSASNVTWYGPLGPMLLVGGLVLAVIAVRRRWIPRLGLLFALAPAYWIAMLAALLFYQDAAGRFLMAPVALAGATWGIALRWRPLAWGLAGGRDHRGRARGAERLEAAVGRGAPGASRAGELLVAAAMAGAGRRAPRPRPDPLRRRARSVRCPSRPRDHGQRCRLPVLRPRPRPPPRPARRRVSRRAACDLGVRQPRCGVVRLSGTVRPLAPVAAEPSGWRVYRRSPGTCENE